MLDRNGIVPLHFQHSDLSVWTDESEGRGCSLLQGRAKKEGRDLEEAVRHHATLRLAFQQDH